MDITPDALLAKAQDFISDLKAEQIVVLHVNDITDITDYMIIASGNSTQHVRSIARNVRTEAKKLGLEVFSAEGLDRGEWVLIDLGDVIVHVMLPEVRDYYQLEKLWSVEDIVTGASSDSEYNA